MKRFNSLEFEKKLVTWNKKPEWREDLGTDPIHQNNLELAKKGAKPTFMGKKGHQRKFLREGNPARISD